MSLLAIARNTTYVTLAGGAAALLGLINLPQIVHAVGLEGFGRIVVLQSIAGAAALILMPQSWQALAKYAQRDPQGRVEDFSSPLFACGYLMETVGGVLTLLTSFAIIALALGPEYHAHLGAYMLAAAGAILANSHVSDQILRERGQFHLLAATQVLSQAAKVLGLWLLSRPGLFEVCMVLFGAEALRLLMALVLARRALPPLAFKGLRQSVPRPFMRCVAWVNLSDIIDLPVRHLDKLVVSMVLGPSAAGLFAIFRKLGGAFSIVADGLYQSSYPVLASLVGQSRAHAGAVAFRIGLGFFSLGIVPLLVLVATPQWWLPLLLPSLQTDLRLEIQVFFIATFVAMCFITVHPLYILCGHEKHNAWITLVSNASYLGLLFLLSGRFGLLGAVSAVAVQFFLVIALKLVHLRLALPPPRAAYTS